MKQVQQIRNFAGVNKGRSQRDGKTFLQKSINFDSNLVEGQLVSRGGFANYIDTATSFMDKFVNYRDEKWGKDVIIAYIAHTTPASRELRVYTRTIGTGSYTRGSGYSYGNVALFGDDVTFLVDRSGVRVGTGNTSTNRALYAGYIDRSGDNQMFNDQISFNDFFVKKQQWVQQADLFNGLADVYYDSTREKYYCLTTRGLEIRDSDFYVERILDDVQSWAVGLIYFGTVRVSGNNLFVLGRERAQSGGNDVYTIVKYAMDDGYEKSSDELSKTDSTGDVIYDFTLTSTKVWTAWTDGTDSFIGEYTHAFAVTNEKRYTAAGETTPYGIIDDATYVYLAEGGSPQITQMHQTTFATASVAVTGVSRGFDLTGGLIYYVNHTATQTNIYTVDTPSPFTGATETLRKTVDDFHAKCTFVDGSDPWTFDSTKGRIERYDGATAFTDDGAVTPGIIHAAVSADGTSATGGFFYAVSLVDIYGQESHLMAGCKTNEVSGVQEKLFKVFVNADAETYNTELTSPSNDPTATNSIWNEFRLVKTVRVWRAYSSAARPSEPETAYRLLREIDINDIEWEEVTNNELYLFQFWDNTDEGEMSTVTYESSSGLPERFKPYYVNWLYANKLRDRFYYGNFYDSEERYQNIIEAPPSSPDVLYPHDQNQAAFGVGDGDEIKGLAPSWNRLVVMKSQVSAVYNGLSEEATFDIGLYAPESIVVHNNRVYFLSNEGFYVLTPSGYQRISQAVDEDLAAEADADLADCSGAFYKVKGKIWWHLPGENSYLYNIRQGTWDNYDINSAAAPNQAFVGVGVVGEMLTCDTTGKIFLHESGASDGGSDMTVQLTTADIEVGGGFLDTLIHRVFLTFDSSDDVTLNVKYINTNGEQTLSPNLTSPARLTTVQQYLSGAFAQTVKFDIAQTITGTLTIDSIGLEHHVVRSSRVGEVG